MRRDFRRGTLGALALGTLVACGGEGTPSPDATPTRTRQGLLDGPDLAVTSLRAPPSALSGSTFPVNLTLCNQGNWSAGMELMLVLSEDSDLSVVTDPVVDSVYFGYQPPGQCVQHIAWVTAPQQGTWYLGAIADPYGYEPESNEGNNTRLHGPMGIGYGPDFVITEVKGDASSAPGAAFEASVTVCNQGTASDAAMVQLYLSTDATGPRPEDPPVWGAWTDFLSPGQCRAVPMMLPANPPPPGTEGAYFLSAIVDPDNERFELIEDNNAHAGYRMGVGHRPDFTVTHVRAPASRMPGQPLVVDVTVCNQGTEADFLDVEVYLSADATLRPSDGTQPPEDFLVGAVSLGHFPPHQCHTTQVYGHAELPPSMTGGAVYLGAVVDPHDQRAEFFEDNNTGPLHRMGVGYQPDFIITSVKGPTAVRPDAPFQARVTVCNQGTAGDSTEVELYLSADATLRPWTQDGPQEDARVGQAFVGYLNPEQCTTVPVSGTATVPYASGPGSFHLGAVVNPHPQWPEFLADNNTYTGDRMGVGNAPDFTVAEVKGPGGVAFGQPLTARVKVCNQGTETGQGDVTLLLSADDRIPPIDEPGPIEDRPVGSAPVGPLAPGQCVDVSVSGSAYPPAPGGEGPYYLGAAVMPSLGDLNPENNTRVGDRVGLGSRPDFVVTGVKGPPSALPGQSFTSQVTVCNQGTQTDNAEVMLLLSTDDVILPWQQPGVDSDVFLGATMVGALAPGQCSTVSVPGSLNSQPYWQSAYHVGAFVDPGFMRSELIEDNNAHPGYRLGVGNGPDFIVTNVKGPGSVRPGQPLTAQVTVCNQGTQPDGADVNLYLSAEPLSPPDSGPSMPQVRIVGSAPTPYLSPGQCAQVPVTGPANLPSPDQEGAWHLGAIVDAGNQRLELIEDNNLHPGYVLGVGNRPDFIVTGVTGPTSVQPGQPLTAKVTVCNQGTQPGDLHVALLLSADEVIRRPEGTSPYEDVLVVGAQFGSLPPDQCATVPLTGSATAPPPGPDHPFHLGAIVDPDNATAEILEDNNTHAGYRLGVGSRPDFVVTEVKGPASVLPGQLLTARVTVCNQGTQPETAEVELYLSADTLLRRSTTSVGGEDTRLGRALLGALAPGQCATASVSGNAYLPPQGSEGLYHLGAWVDPANQRPELIEDNNVHTLTRVGVGERLDFVITEVNGPGAVKLGQPLTAWVTVCNQGTWAGDASVGLFLSQQGSASTSTRSPVGFTSTGLLQPGQCAPVPVTGPAYPPAPGLEGLYQLGAEVDPGNQRPEFNEDNNTHAGYGLGIGNLPDFVVTHVKGPASVTSGQLLTAQVTVCNRGTEPGDIDVGLFLSADAVIQPGTAGPTAGDMPVGFAPTGPLNPEQCATVTVKGSAYLPPPGTEGAWNLGAFVDPGAQRPELNEDNNTHPGYVLGVGNRADFIVAAVKAPASVQAGQTLTALVTVCNQGTQPGVPEVLLAVSADTDIRVATGPTQPQDDRIVGSTLMPAINPGQCGSARVSGTAYPPAPGDGPFYLGALVDPDSRVAELIESNNVLATHRLGVGNRPDFTVTAVTGPSSVTPGAPLTAQVTVCNQGTLPGSADVGLYLSPDANLLPSGPGGFGEDILVSRVTLGTLSPSQCVTVPISGSAQRPPPGVDGAYHLGAIVDPGNAVLELNEDNNTHAGYRLGLGYQPDFVVTEVKGPARSVAPGSGFSVSVTVCNRGTQSDLTDVYVYLSADDTLHLAEDFRVGVLAGMGGTAGKCVSRMLNAPGLPMVPEGGYTLIAVVDPENTRMELIEDNNTLAGDRLGLGRQPDFVIESVTSPSSVRAGASLNIDAAICNRGLTSGSVDVEFFLFASPGTGTRTAPPDAIFLGRVTGVPISAGQCFDHYSSRAVPSWLPEGTYYVGAVADPTNTRVEVIEDNNVRVAGRVGVGLRPDFVVTSVTAPTSVQLGAALTTTVTVCNRGTVTATTDVDLFFSVDTYVRAPMPSLPAEDTFLGTVANVSVGASQCVTRTVPVNANAPAAGSYYVGAVADPRHSAMEHFEDNNTLAGTFVSVMP
ncbi:hypothetical protein HPC49_06170 [Pyxidicoccus fallax]|uniref:CARDB domain-containing protein n=1 Tax=Pyxidicoccus fallax TaxID=394095 RepID=A0A848LHY8_9BACT|nr:CARDB domain-containing protein [Pyxidicoccus fallax]NMO16768.1 hypothetical protein [Pyxidicoccus fallax]NPC77839.1 hypothetical protein [Pyxidicoccus fallax]